MRAKTLNLVPTFKGKHNEIRAKAWLLLLDNELAGKSGLKLSELVKIGNFDYKSLSVLISRWIRWNYVGYRSCPGGRIYKLRRRGRAWLERWQATMPIERYISELENVQRRCVMDDDERAAAIRAKLDKKRQELKERGYNFTTGTYSGAGESVGLAVSMDNNNLEENADKENVADNPEWAAKKEVWAAEAEAISKQHRAVIRGMTEADWKTRERESRKARKARERESGQVEPSASSEVDAGVVKQPCQKLDIKSRLDILHQAWKARRKESKSRDLVQRAASIDRITLRENTCILDVEEATEGILEQWRITGDKAAYIVFLLKYDNFIEAEGYMTSYGFRPVGNMRFVLPYEAEQAREREPEARAKAAEYRQQLDNKKLRLRSGGGG